MSKSKDSVKVTGMFRLHIVDPDGTIAGDSGWQKNIITNAGYNNIVNQLGTGLTGSKMAYANLGTGGAPAAADTTLAGELTTSGATGPRNAVTASLSGTKTLLNTVTFASGVYTAAANISNIGLFSTTGATNTGSLLAGQTYTSSALATNQAVNATYQINFS